MGDNICQTCVVELLHKDGDTWSTSRARIGDIEKLNQRDTPNACRPSFVYALQIRECEKCRQFVTQYFKIPLYFWTIYCQRSNGYFGCENSYDGAEFEGHNTWFRFLVKQTLPHAGQGEKDYVWHKINMFTRWLPTGRNVTISFDTPNVLRGKFPMPILENLDPQSFQDPYWIHARLIQEVTTLQDESVWSIRDQVRLTETGIQSRTSLTRHNPDYLGLHEIARHAIHSSETLDVAVKTLENILTQHDHFFKGRPTINEGIRISYTQTRMHLYFYSQLLQSIRSRSHANKERLQNQITLAFHTVAQYDSRVAVQIGQAAQSDSAAMKTIAVLTLTFLPATLISAIFSMTFFNYSPGSADQPGRWSVSDKAWIYCAVAVPVTCLTLTSWFLWQRYWPAKAIGS